MVWPLYTGQLYPSHLLIAAKQNCVIDDQIVEVPLYVHVTKIAKNSDMHFSQMVSICSNLQMQVYLCKYVAKRINDV